MTYPININTAPGEEITAISIYAFVTAKQPASDGANKRGYYDFYTNVGSTTYHQFMNVVFSQDDLIANSENILIPLSDDDMNLKVKIPGLYPLLAQAQEDVFESGIYLLGYCTKF